MIKKATKLLLEAQIKSAIWFLFNYAFIVVILSVIFHYIKDVDREWMGISAIYSPKIYLLVIGIVYPLITMELYLSRGLTRRQYFWAFIGAIEILSVVLLLPAVIAEIVMKTITPMSVITNFIQMTLFFLIGWTAVIGFQLRKWYTAFGGIICAIVSFHIIVTIPTWIYIPKAIQIDISLLLIAVQITLISRIIRRIPIKR